MPDPRRTYRAVLAGAPPLLAVVPGVVLLATAGDRLPERVATHFGPTGAADGFSGRGPAILTFVLLGAFLAAVFGASAYAAFGSRAPGSRYDLARWFVGTSWGTAAFVGVLPWTSVAASLDLADPADATLPPTTFLLALPGAVLAGVLGGLLAPASPVGDGEPRPTRAAHLGATEQVSWSRTTGTLWLPFAGGVLVAGGITLGLAVHPVAGIGVTTAGLAMLLFAQARVTVDRRGLTVALGVLGWPRVRVPAEDVQAVTVADISPVQFGGWGYRIVPGGRGVIMRAGPAIVVTRRSGRRMTVTVPTHPAGSASSAGFHPPGDDAETGAGLLAAVAAKAG